MEKSENIVYQDALKPHQLGLQNYIKKLGDLYHCKVYTCQELNLDTLQQKKIQGIQSTLRQKKRTNMFFFHTKMAENNIIIP